MPKRKISATFVATLALGAACSASTAALSARINKLELASGLPWSFL